MRPRRVRRRLSRTVRWLVAAAEVVAAVALAFVAVWAWHRASIPVELPEYENPAIPRTVSRMSGPWAGLSIAAATVACVLVLDAIRHAVLGRVGRRTGTGGTKSTGSTDGTGSTAGSVGDTEAATPVA